VQTSNTASVNISGPSSASPGQKIEIQTDMYLPGPVTDVIFETLTSANLTDKFSICSVIVSAGKNFACYPYENVEYVLYPSRTNATNEKATLSMHLVNSGKSFSKVFL
jgi:hypothetical protein